MPYIDPDSRERLEFIDTNSAIQTQGELNYCITQLFKRYMKDHGVSYKVANDIMGAVEGAKLEFYRRIVVPYEDRKIEENGDVY